MTDTDRIADLEKEVAHLTAILDAVRAYSIDNPDHGLVDALTGGFEPWKDRQRRPAMRVLANQRAMILQLADRLRASVLSDTRTDWVTNQQNCQLSTIADWLRLCVGERPFWELPDGYVEPLNLWTEAIQMLRRWLTAYPGCGVTGLKEARNGCCRTCDTRLLLRAIEAAEGGLASTGAPGSAGQDCEGMMMLIYWSLGSCFLGFLIGVVAAGRNHRVKQEILEYDLETVTGERDMLAVYAEKLEQNKQWDPCTAYKCHRPSCDHNPCSIKRDADGGDEQHCPRCGLMASEVGDYDDSPRPVGQDEEG
ncbi:MAG: hypothetical protein GTN69_03465 [Armatimonadetes bacterium]|nr:hypothetical protein [Armatimonadota bacterium]